MTGEYEGGKREREKDENIPRYAERGRKRERLLQNSVKKNNLAFCEKIFHLELLTKHYQKEGHMKMTYQASHSLSITQKCMTYRDTAYLIK